MYFKYVGLNLEVSYRHIFVIVYLYITVHVEFVTMIKICLYTKFHGALQGTEGNTRTQEGGAVSRPQQTTKRVVESLQIFAYTRNSQLPSSSD
jgi:hypothetical protein